MYNNQKPNLDELPTNKQLIRSTRRSLVIAILILVTVILPAEYGIDPTGIGNVLGLKEMGEIKESLAMEAEAQEKKNIDNQITKNDSFQSVDELGVDSQPKIKSQSMKISIPDNGSIELKATMKKGGRIEYSWSTDGGRLNYNVHGEPIDPSNGTSYEYDDGKNRSEYSGNIEAVYDGTHGWFWRNRSGETVVITIDVKGEFTTLKQI